MLKNIKMNNN